MTTPANPTPEPETPPDVRGTTANPYPIEPERKLYEHLNQHCCSHGYNSAEDAVFAWIEQLVIEAPKSFCARSAILQSALTGKTIEQKCNQPAGSFAKHVDESGETFLPLFKTIDDATTYAIEKLAERDAARMQLDQACAIIQGKSLTAEEVNKSGLGEWALIEQRRAEQQLADTRRRLAEVEKERDALIVTTETLTKHMRSVMDSRNAYMCNSGKAELRAVIAEKKLTALRNAADGLRDRLKIRNDKEAEELGDATAMHEVFNPHWANQIERDSAALAAYSALIAEGAGK